MGVEKLDLFGGGTTSDAVLSDCGRYRYLLTRTWDDAVSSALFVMLNQRRST